MITPVDPLDRHLASLYIATSRLATKTGTKSEHRFPAHWTSLPPLSPYRHLQLRGPVTGMSVLRCRIHDGRRTPLAPPVRAFDLRTIDKLRALVRFFFDISCLQTPNRTNGERETRLIGQSQAIGPAGGERTGDRRLRRGLVGERVRPIWTDRVWAGSASS